MTPRELDWIISGMPVYINKRPHDGGIYATIHDYSRFNIKPLATVRVPLKDLTKADDALTHPTVTAKIKEFS